MKAANSNKRYAVKPVSDCLGARLAHGLAWQSADGRGVKIAKGALINQKLMATLTAASFETIAVIRPHAGDVFEAEAASLLADLFDTQAFDLKPAPGGRLNIYAKHHGLFFADVDQVNHLNSSKLNK